MSINISDIKLKARNWTRFLVEKEWGSARLCFVGIYIIYLFSNPAPQIQFDYTYRIAQALLHGHLGLQEKPPLYLNEMIPQEGLYYSVFPFGSVLTLLPVAILRSLGIIDEFPAAEINALIAGTIAVFIYFLALHYKASRRICMVFVTAIMLGTWMWCNLAFGSAWQMALGFAVLGELGAIYFTIAKSKPLVAGMFFSMAYGNRTEIILVAPVFMYLFYLNSRKTKSQCNDDFIWMEIQFLIFPFVLGVCTLIYNAMRFHSFFDFGYARIPHVLEESWYRHGIFSLDSIPLNAKTMLLKPWIILNHFPYLIPSGFGGSILLSSPFLISVFRTGGRDVCVKTSAWVSVVLLTFLLWIHGNPGGWQFGYRYGMILLPWIFLILLENKRGNFSFMEYILITYSVIANTYSVYLFLWTGYIHH